MAYTEGAVLLFRLLDRMDALPSTFSAAIAGREQ